MKFFHLNISTNNQDRLPLLSAPPTPKTFSLKLPKPVIRAIAAAMCILAGSALAVGMWISLADLMTRDQNDQTQWPDCPTDSFLDCVDSKREQTRDALIMGVFVCGLGFLVLVAQGCATLVQAIKERHSIQRQEARSEPAIEILTFR